MVNYYRIANNIIKIDTPFENYDETYIAKFRAKDLENIRDIEDNIDLYYEIIEDYDKKIFENKVNIKKYINNVDNNNEANTESNRVEKIDAIIDKSKGIYINSGLEIYNEDKFNVWNYRYDVGYEEYASLVEEENSDYRRLFLYENKDIDFSNTSKIFFKSNLQGALLSKKTLILHSSFIIHNNESILFTGVSGIGKSTQAGLWKEYQGAEIINGDRSAIREEESGFYAYGLPFCGSSKICVNKEAPIKAIVVLEQKKYNEVKVLSKLEAFKILIGQVAINRWNKKDMLLAMNLVEKLIENIKVVKLSCLPNADATKVLKEYLYR